MERKSEKVRNKDQRKQKYRIYKKERMKNSRNIDFIIPLSN